MVLLQVTPLRMCANLFSNTSKLNFSPSLMHICQSAQQIFLAGLKLKPCTILRGHTSKISQTLSLKQKVIKPTWFWIPIDLKFHLVQPTHKISAPNSRKSLWCFTTVISGKHNFTISSNQIKIELITLLYYLVGFPPDLKNVLYDYVSIAMPRGNPNFLILP